MAEVAEIWREIVARDCKEETAEPVEGVVTGEIPKWINGCFLRNGPGMTEIGGQKYNHWFDGLAVLHCFGMTDGKVTYRSKFIRSDSYLKNIQANRIVVGEFGTSGHPDPCATIFEKFRSFFKLDITDNTNVNVFKIGDSFYAGTETSNLNKVDVKTASTIDRVNISDYVAVNSSTAHPHIENDGTYYNLGNSYKAHSSYNFVKFPPSQKPGLESFQKGSIVCEIPASMRTRPSYYHSFGMTENYFILAEQSLGLNLTSMLWTYVPGTKPITYLDCLTFDKNQLTNFLVVDKNTGKQVKQRFVANALMVFHHANAYEEDGHIVMDLAGYDDDTLVKLLTNKELERAVAESSDRIAEALTGQARRYVLPLNASKEGKENANLVTLAGTDATAKYLPDGSIHCMYENLSPGLKAIEMPQINYDNYNTKKYKYLYGIGGEAGYVDTKLVKLNVQDKTHMLWSEKGKHPSEPVFVPSPNAVEEDDGILLSSLLHRDNEKKVDLIFLDARTMKELGRAKFEAKSAVTSCFHGPFVPNSA